MWLKYMPMIKGSTFYRTNSKLFLNESTGEMEEPPLRALSVEEAIKQYNESKGSHMLVEAADIEEACKNGVCEV